MPTNVQSSVGGLKTNAHVYSQNCLELSGWDKHEHRRVQPVFWYVSSQEDWCGVVLKADGNFFSTEERKIIMVEL